MLVCTEKGCDKAAAYTYTWAWGEVGHCCHDHHVVVVQRAAQLDRQVTFIAAAADTESRPLVRDERTRLIAEKLSAEGERDETKRHNVELFNLNTQMAHELRTLRARNIELDTQSKDARGDVEKIARERDEMATKLHDARAEISTLTLLAHVDPQKPQKQPAAKT